MIKMGNPDRLKETNQVAFKLGFEAGIEIRRCGLKVRSVAKRFKNPFAEKSDDYSAFDYGKLEGYSKVPRTWEYLPTPSELGAICQKCRSEDLQWSEWENHTWCNKCGHESDEFESDLKHSCIVDTSKVNRWNLQKNRLEVFDIKKQTMRTLSSGSKGKITEEKLPVIVSVVNKDMCYLLPNYELGLSKGEWWKAYSNFIQNNPHAFKNVVENLQEMMNENRIKIIRQSGEFNLIETV